jgi:hypothetical protein
MSKCHNSNCKNNFDRKIESSVSSYYRNKDYQTFFCSQICKETFNKLQRCQYCKYSADIIIAKNGLAYCNCNEPWAPKCYKQYLKKQSKRELILEFKELLKEQVLLTNDESEEEILSYTDTIEIYKLCKEYLEKFKVNS